MVGKVTAVPLHNLKGPQMPRKSKALRLQQAQELVAAYESSNLTDDYRARFARDTKRRGDRKMEKERLPRGAHGKNKVFCCDTANKTTSKKKS